VIELLPAVAGGLYHRDSSGLALLTTASGVGAVIGGALLSKMGSTDRLPGVASRSAMWLGVIVVGVGAAPSFWLTAGAVFVMGIISVVCGVGLQVLLQKTIDASFRGRVLGLWGMCNVAGPGIGGAIIGAAEQVFGLRGATLISGVVSTALAVWIVQRSRELSGKAKA
jgi:sugar phosphate permease